MKNNNNLGIFSLFQISTCFLCFFLSNCGIQGSVSEDLSGNYSYKDHGSDWKEIIPNSNNFRKAIFSKVIDYDYNKNFIIAVQKPNYEIQQQSISSFLLRNIDKYPNNDQEDRTNSMLIADSLLKYDNFFKNVFSDTINYWIIAIEQNLLIGPLNKEEFDAKKIELKVPENLKLKLPKH